MDKDGEKKKPKKLLERKWCQALTQLLLTPATWNPALPQFLNSPSILWAPDIIPKSSVLLKLAVVHFCFKEQTWDTALALLLGAVFIEDMQGGQKEPSFSNLL